MNHPALIVVKLIRRILGDNDSDVMNHLKVHEVMMSGRDDDFIFLRSGNDFLGIGHECNHLASMKSLMPWRDAMNLKLRLTLHPINS